MRVASLVLGFALIGGVARAEPLVVSIEITGDDDAALVDRVEGQVSDLDVELVRGPDERAGARVWFERDGDGWLVSIAEPGTDRVLVRRVGASGDLAGSATAEAVALVVRAALRAIAAGVPAEAPVVEPPAPPPPPPPPPPEPRARPFAALGWRGVVGSAELVQQSAQARAGLARGRWRAGIDLAIAAPVAIDRDDASIEVGRGSIALAGGVDLVHAPAWRLALELGGGAVRYDRTTTSVSGALMPTAPAATWAPVVAPGVRLGRRIAAGAWLELAVGAEILLRVPEFGVPTAGGFVVHTRLSPVQPSAGLGLTIEVLP